MERVLFISGESFVGHIGPQTAAALGGFDAPETRENDRARECWV